MLGMGAAATSAAASQIDGPIVVRIGRPITVTSLKPGDWMKVLLDGELTLFIRRRTDLEIAEVRRTPLDTLPDPEEDAARTTDPQWIIVSGRCTHAGCDVVCGQGPFEGWACFCHGSYYDLSGRVRGGPAKRNLDVVHFSSDDTTLNLLGVRSGPI